MNPPPRFFGYGSLVNRATHDYPDVQRVSVQGWARSWRHTSLSEIAFLTAVPDANSTIEGLSAAVPNDDWAALDEREYAYQRVPLVDQAQTAIYAIAPDAHDAGSAQFPILLSYLDVVVQGYLAEFGEAGAALFFATTHGWDTPILNDRADPLYPRHQRLSADQTAFVDESIYALGCRLIAP